MTGREDDIFFLFLNDHSAYGLENGPERGRGTSWEASWVGGMEAGTRYQQRR